MGYAHTFENPPPDREYSFAAMVQLFGLRSLSERAQVDTLRRMAENEGLPTPKNPRWRGGKAKRYHEAIGRKSVWNAQQVDDWRAQRDHPGVTRAQLNPKRSTLGHSLSEAMSARTRAMGRSAS